MKKLLLVLSISMFLAFQPVSVLANSPAPGWDPVDTTTVVGGTDVAPIVEAAADSIVSNSDVLPANTTASAITAFTLTADSNEEITVSVKSVLVNVSVICSNGPDFALATATFTPESAPAARSARTATVANKGTVTFTIPAAPAGAANFDEFVVVATKNTPAPTTAPDDNTDDDKDDAPAKAPTSPKTSSFPIDTAVASFATLSLAGGLVLRKKRNS